METQQNVVPAYRLSDADLDAVEQSALVAGDEAVQALVDEVRTWRKATPAEASAPGPVGQDVERLRALLFDSDSVAWQGAEGLKEAQDLFEGITSTASRVPGLEMDLANVRRLHGAAILGGSCEAGRQRTELEDVRAAWLRETARADALVSRVAALEQEVRQAHAEEAGATSRMSEAEAKGAEMEERLRVTQESLDGCTRRVAGLAKKDTPALTAAVRKALDEYVLTAPPPMLRALGEALKAAPTPAPGLREAVGRIIGHFCPWDTEGRKYIQPVGHEADCRCCACELLAAFNGTPSAATTTVRVGVSAGMAAPFPIMRLPVERPTSCDCNLPGCTGCCRG